MLSSPRAAPPSIDDAISTARANENRLTDILSLTAQEAERRRKQLADCFRALALIRLDALAQHSAVAELDAAERRALDLLRTHKAKLDQLSIKHDNAQRTVAAAETDHRSKTAALAAAAESIKSLQAEVERRMADDSAWKGQRARVDALANTAEAAGEKAKQAEADRDAKRKPYEGDPLFMYLWKCGFATGAYKSGPVTRYFDRKVAALVDFETARPNYVSLNEIPLRLREHANHLARRVAEEDRKLEEIERAALIAAGILPLEATLAAAQRELDAANDALAKAQEALAVLDEERVKLLDEDGRRAHEEAQAVLAQAIAREDLQAMYRQARITRTPDDDRLVSEIEQTQLAIAQADTEIVQLRNELREIARRHGELERVRHNLRLRRHNHLGAELAFDRLHAMDDLVRVMMRDAFHGPAVRTLFEQGRRGISLGPRFRFSSSSSRKIVREIVTINDGR